jgi:hypothetical protein
MKQKHEWILGAIAALVAALVLFAASVAALVVALPKE